MKNNNQNRILIAWKKPTLTRLGNANIVTRNIFVEGTGDNMLDTLAYDADDPYSTT